MPRWLVDPAQKPVQSATSGDRQLQLRRTTSYSKPHKLHAPHWVIGCVAKGDCMKIFLSVALVLAMTAACGGEDPGDTPDTTPPSVASAAPVDYTHADVTFSEEVDAATAETLTNYAVTPSRPFGQGISAVSLESATVVRLTFAEPLFPLAYTVTVSGVEDVAGNPMAADETADFTGNGKLAYVTVATGTGDLSSWADAGGATGLEAADAVCQAEATHAGFVGTFKAWLSDSYHDARDRIGTDSGPWLRTDGFPFTSSMTSLLTENEVLVPLQYDTGGARLNYSISSAVWTRTGVDGAKSSANEDCLDWSSGADTEAGAGGYFDASAVFWTRGLAGLDCDNLFHLYCFQTGAGPAVPEYRSEGKVVFVTSTRGTGNLSTWAETDLDGHAGGDEICQVRAAAAGLANASTFKAWISTEIPLLSALDHLASDGPWVLLNGLRVADNKADLTDGYLFSAITIDETGANQAELPDPYVPQDLLMNFAWTGTASDGSGLASSHTCGDWAGLEDSGAVGWISLVDVAWTTLPGLDGDCETSLVHLYCFEDE